LDERSGNPSPGKNEALSEPSKLKVQTHSWFPTVIASKSANLTIGILLPQNIKEQITDKYIPACRVNTFGSVIWLTDYCKHQFPLLEAPFLTKIK
jgi:hypothetical protein